MIGCMDADRVEDFFAFARERHAIYLRRQAGFPWPWTEDRVLQTGRFTNVFRELDRTTKWFREHVRDPLRDRPEVLLATVIFRWFNRTTTGEAIFCQPCLPSGPGEPGQSAFEELIHELKYFPRKATVAPLRHSINQYLPKGPFITGAYTINTRSAGLGLTKLEGVLRLIEMWLERHSGEPMAHWRDIAEHRGGSMEEFCGWVQSPCLAGFMAYEIACDLRYTAVLEHAPDWNTWANVGPGAVRGLNRIHGRPVGKNVRQDQALDEMGDLLGVAQTDGHYWPLFEQSLDARLPPDRFLQELDLRAIEHTLCESDKYQRVKEGAGQTRGKFSWPK